MKNEIRQLPMTYLLLAVTGLVFLWMQIRYGAMAATSQAVFESGGMFGRYLQAYPSQIWRLVSPIFVHIGWQHAVMNLFSIYIVGQFVERIWGSRRFALLYLLSGVMGNAFTLFFTPDVVAAGASTALFGSFGALAVLGKMTRNPYLKHLGQSYLAMIVVNLVFNLFTPNVSLVGHLGGLVGGVLAGVFLLPEERQSIFTRWHRVGALILYGLLLVLILYLSL